LKNKNHKFQSLADRLYEGHHDFCLWCSNERGTKKTDYKRKIKSQKKEGSDGEKDEQKKYKTFRKNKVKSQK